MTVGRNDINKPLFCPAVAVVVDEGEARGGDGRGRVGEQVANGGTEVRRSLVCAGMRGPGTGRTRANVTSRQSREVREAWKSPAANALATLTWAARKSHSGRARTERKASG